MAEEIKVVLNEPGIRTLLNGPEVQAFLLDKAREMEFAAESNAMAGSVYEDEPPRFESSVQPGKNRARASVITANKEARIAEAQGRALSSSIDALRG